MVLSSESLTSLLAQRSPLRSKPNTSPSSRKLFGTDGIRGKAGQLLNPALVVQVGFWAGKVLQQEQGRLGPLIMGQDSRCSSDMLAMSLASGLTAAGLEVWNMGLCPTPAVAHLTHTTDALGGVMISASHNPPEDNGIKFFDADGAKLPLEVQQMIEDRLHFSDIHSVTGQVWGRHYHRPELTQTYLEALQTPFPPTLTLQGLKIVLDLAWGAATQLAPVCLSA